VENSGHILRGHIKNTTVLLIRMLLKYKKIGEIYNTGGMAIPGSIHHADKHTIKRLYEITARSAARYCIAAFFAARHCLATPCAVLTLDTKSLLFNSLFISKHFPINNITVNKEGSY